MLLLWYCSKELDFVQLIFLSSDFLSSTLELCYNIPTNCLLHRMFIKRGAFEEFLSHFRVRWKYSFQFLRPARISILTLCLPASDSSIMRFRVGNCYENYLLQFPSGGSSGQKLIDWISVSLWKGNCKTFQSQAIRLVLCVLLHLTVCGVGTGLFPRGRDFPVTPLFDESRRSITTSRQSSFTGSLSPAKQ